MNSENVEMKRENIKLKNTRGLVIFILLSSLILFTIYLFYHAFRQRVIYDTQYCEAKKLYEENNYDEAIEILKTLQDYNNGAELLNVVETEKEYSEAVELLNNGKYNQAIEKFSKIKDFEDSNEKIDEAKYKLALEYYNRKDYASAKKIFVELDDYLESEIYLAQIEIINIEQSKKIIYKEACENFENKYYEKALELFENIADYEDSLEKIEESKKLIKRQLSATIVSGLHYSMAIKDNNKSNEIICTDNRYKFEGWDNVISISGFGTMVVGLNEDGTVELEGHKDKYDIKGKDIWNVEISDWGNIIQVSSGQQHIVGLKDDGTVVSAGLVQGTEDWKDIKMIASGWEHIVGLDLNGVIYISGNVSDMLKEEIEKSKGDWKDIISIDTGGGNSSNVYGKGHVVGLRKDGTVIAVGDNDYGQCAVYGEEWTDIVAISAGDFHTVGLKSDGTVVATKIPSDAPVPKDEIDMYRTACNVYGEKWEDIVAISAGYGTTLGLNKDGEIVAAGFDTDDQIPKDYEWTDIVRYDEWRSMKGDDLK